MGAKQASRRKQRKFYDKFKPRVEKHKKARVMREFKRAGKNKDNALSRKLSPESWHPVFKKS